MAIDRETVKIAYQRVADSPVLRDKLRREEYPNEFPAEVWVAAFNRFKGVHKMMATRSSSRPTEAYSWSD